MACYWDFNTVGNRISYSAFAIFLITGIILLAVGGSKYNTCYKNYVQPCKNVMQGYDKLCINGDCVDCWDYANDYCPIYTYQAVWIAGIAAALIAFLSTSYMCCCSTRPSLAAAGFTTQAPVAVCYPGQYPMVYPTPGGAPGQPYLQPRLNPEQGLYPNQMYAYPVQAYPTQPTAQPAACVTADQATKQHMEKQV